MNCKPGDLAVTVGMVEPANNGIIVEVLSLVETDEQGGVWHIRHRRPMLIDDGPDSGHWVDHGEIYDCNLRPISGVPLDEEPPTETTVAVTTSIPAVLDVQSWWFE